MSQTCRGPHAAGAVAASQTCCTRADAAFCCAQSGVERTVWWTFGIPLVALAAPEDPLGAPVLAELAVALVVRAAQVGDSQHDYGCAGSCFSHLQTSGSSDCPEKLPRQHAGLACPSKASTSPSFYQLPP